MAIELMLGLLIDGLTMALSTQEVLERTELIGFHVEVLAWIHHQQRLSPESVVSRHGKNFPLLRIDGCLEGHGSLLLTFLN